METPTIDTPVDGFTTSPDVGELMMALAKAQATMENPDEDSDNPFFQSRYASLGAVINAVLPPLNAQGIAVTQFGIANLRDKSFTCTTVFWLGNQFLHWRLTFPVVKMGKRGEAQEGRGELNKQDYAGVNTYARRIMLMGMAGVAGEPDDDGNDVSTQGSGQPRRDKQPSPRQEKFNKRTGEIREDVEDRDTPEDHRLTLLQHIAVDLTKHVSSLRHAGLYKAILHHCFEADHSTIKTQPLPVLEAGMPLFLHLCEELQAQHWSRTQHPDEWIADEQRKLAALARGDAPMEEGTPSEDVATEGPSWGGIGERNLMQEEEDEAEPWGKPSAAAYPPA
jgi:hypothetical protein